MSNPVAPDVALGALALAAAMLYGAWREYAAGNRRDARLLVAMGAASLAGSAVALL